jgi:hypothetical protein
VGRKPDFIIIGAQKAGTTWLAGLLNRSKNIYLNNKEIHFFNLDLNYKKGAKWYESHFKDSVSDQLVGEKTPDYFLRYNSDGTNSAVLDRMYEYNNDLRLIIVLRNPVNRAISALKHHIRYRRISPLDDPEDILFGSKSYLSEHWNLLNYGLYCRHLNYCLELFGEQQCLVLIFENEIKKSESDILSSVSNFLNKKINVDGNSKKGMNKGFNSRMALILNWYLPWFSWVWNYLDDFFIDKYKVSNECREKLYRYYEEETERLEKLLKIDLSIWKN